jgi:DNA sulfur modification protein DndB
MPRHPATKVEQNRFTFYSAVLPGKEILPSCFVSRRAEDPEKGFNRSLTRSRAIDIARYLDRGLTIPTNIILSAQPAAGFRFSRGHVSWESVERAFLVIDGQHRLMSMEFAERDFDFTFAVYDGLSEADEVQLFIDINTNQKGVPPALLLDIKQLAGAETSMEERLRQLFDAVAADRESPLYGRLSASASKAGMVSRVSFNNALKKPMEAGVLSTMSGLEDERRLVVNYLIAFDRTIVSSGAQNNDLSKATILQAAFEIFNDVVDATIARVGKLKADDLALTIQPLTGLDFDAYIGSNRPSKAKLVADMRAALIASPTVTSDML